MSRVTMRAGSTLQLRDSVRLRQMVARDFEQIQASVGEMLLDRHRGFRCREPFYLQGDTWSLTVIGTSRGSFTFR